jgi:hypothetical protein
MLVADATAMIQGLLQQHLLTGWTLEWSDTIKIVQLDAERRVLQFSRNFVESNNEALVRDLALHEIGHALRVPKKLRWRFPECAGWWG